MACLGLPLLRPNHDINMLRTTSWASGYCVGKVLGRVRGLCAHRDLPLHSLISVDMPVLDSYRSVSPSHDRGVRPISTSAFYIELEKQLRDLEVSTIV